MIIAIGFGLVLLSFVLGLIPALVQGIPQISAPVAIVFGLLLIGYGLLQLPIFALLFFWAGMRGVSKYGLSRGGGGLVAVFSYVVIAVIHLVFSIITNLIGVGSTAVGSALGQGQGDQMATALMGGVLGGVSAVICTAGILLVGVVMNFVIGYLGGWFGSRR